MNVSPILAPSSAKKFNVRTFSLVRKTVEPDALRCQVERPEAGAFLAFEGWVRNRNDGHPVTGLTYEAYPELAVTVGEQIIAEAEERFDTLVVRAAHAIGELNVGELAVWVGVSAAHRDDAFAACRYVIDELKERLPVWKREHYVNAPPQFLPGTPMRVAPAHEEALGD